MYTPTMKMADAIADRSVIMLLDSLRFRLGFGDATIDEVCRKRGYPTHIFLMLANVCTDANYVPDTASLSRDDAPAIIEYVKYSHKYFSESVLPYLHSLIHKALSDEDAVYADVLNRYFDELLHNVNAHFEAEELSFESGGNGAVPGEAEAHFEFLEKLEDLRNLIVRYLPDNSTNNARYLILSGLQDLEQSLRGHIEIEEKILLPLEEIVGTVKNGRSEDSSSPASSETLSQREKEIVAAVAHGKTNKEIADDLFISINTVVTHRKNIARKTGINSIAGLTVYAILNDIVRLKDLNIDKL
jgi:DNA-binding CsgD family transcriptional regulator